MKALRFRQPDRIVEIDLPADFEWRLGEDLDERRKRLGYVIPLWSLGTGDVGASAYSRGEQHPNYCVEMRDVETTEMVYVDDEADLFAARAYFARLVADIATADAADYVSMVLRRLFRATHGHDPSVACRGCDPDEVDRCQRHRKERR